MTYITIKQHREPKEVTWEDVMFNENLEFDFLNQKSKTTGTITKKVEKLDDRILRSINVDSMIKKLQKFNDDNAELFEDDEELHYKHFKIPKKTGGWRPIDAPDDKLQNALGRLAEILTEDFGVLYHTAAFAYVPGRSIVDCLKKHQANESLWYLKTDFSGFFPSTTLDYTMRMCSMIFPLSEICKNEEGKEALKKALSLGFLNGGLPQGTKLSPTLTNMISIPLDHALFNALAKRKIIYTRYADDMHISAKEKFPYKEIVKLIQSTLEEFGAPYELKEEKTHFGSRKGKNWCLGLKVNATNDISVGWQQKKYFKAELTNFALDTKNGKMWPADEVMSLRGKLSYYEMVEKDYFERVIERMNSKWNINLKGMFRLYM